MKRLMSHGMTTRNEKSQHTPGTRSTSATPIQRMEGERQTQSDRAGLPHIPRKGSEKRHGRRSGLIRDIVLRALQAAVGRPRSGGGTGHVCHLDSDSTDQRETVRGDGMHKPGGGEVRNQRQTPTATNWHNAQTTRGSYTGSTRQGNLRQTLEQAQCDS